MPQWRESGCRLLGRRHERRYGPSAAAFSASAATSRAARRAAFSAASLASLQLGAQQPSRAPIADPHRPRRARRRGRWRLRPGLEKCCRAPTASTRSFVVFLTTTSREGDRRGDVRGWRCPCGRRRSGRPEGLNSAEATRRRQRPVRGLRLRARRAVHERGGEGRLRLSRATLVGEVGAHGSRSRADGRRRFEHALGQPLAPMARARWNASITRVDASASASTSTYAPVMEEGEPCIISEASTARRRRIWRRAASRSRARARSTGDLARG